MVVGQFLENIKRILVDKPSVQSLYHFGREGLLNGDHIIRFPYSSLIEFAVHNELLKVGLCGLDLSFILVSALEQQILDFLIPLLLSILYMAEPTLIEDTA